MERNPRSYNAISIEEGINTTTTTKVQIPLHERFIGTLVCSVAYPPFILWSFFLLRRFISGQYDCEALMDLPMIQTICALTLMTVLIPIFVVIVRVDEEKQISGPCTLAVMGLMLVLFVGLFGIPGFMEAMESKTIFGVFGSSLLAATGNNTEYWKANMKTCECKSRHCEDFVYREYLADRYWNNHTAYVSSLQNELGSCKPSAHCDQILKDGSDPDAMYGKGLLCFSAYSYEKGENGECKGCYACEEEYLNSYQKNCWKFGNALYAMSWLLIVSYSMVFAAEMWDYFRLG